MDDSSKCPCESVESFLLKRCYLDLILAVSNSHTYFGRTTLIVSSNTIVTFSMLSS